MYYNRLSRAGLVLLSFFLLFLGVAAAPLSVRDIGIAPDTEVSRHLTQGDTARGIIHHISTIDQSNQIIPPPNAPSIFKRDEGGLQFVFPARRNFKDRFKAAFKKMGSDIKHIGNTVAHFVQSNKNKIAKVGLKMVSLVGQYGAKGLANIPIIGKPLANGLKIASKFANQASNRYHVNLGGDLGKAMAGMDKAQHIGDLIDV